MSFLVSQVFFAVESGSVGNQKDTFCAESLNDAAIRAER